MASLGFRHPQFSEDLAWLPVWLQRHASEESQPLKDLALAQAPSCETKDVNMVLSNEECRLYSGCHLYLSGEESPTSLVSSPGSVLHFRLHLSSNDNSWRSQCSSQFQLDSKNLLSVEQAEASAGGGQEKNDDVPIAGVEDKFGLSNVVDKAGDGCLLPPISIQKVGGNVGIQSCVNKHDSGRRGEGSLNVGCLEVSEISDAVELSISASEALVIHEIVRNEPASTALSTAAVIEAALQLKQARLEALESEFYFPSESFMGPEEIDALSDLDDWAIADACEDVGLPFFAPDTNLTSGLNASQVKCIPSAHNKEVTHTDFQDQQKHTGPVSHESGQGISNVWAVAETEAHLNSHLSQYSSNFARKHKIRCKERCRSSLFRGYPRKMGIEAPVKLKQNNSKSIPKFYVNETSFLSESADTAPDKNSVAQKHDSRSKIASQSSVPFEGSSGKANEGILVSQDVKSSSLSLVDPLCSVVPCSISTNCAPLTEEMNDMAVDADEQPLQVENLQGTINLNFESFHGETTGLPASHGSNSEALVERQLTSLKNYSLLLPKLDANLEVGKLNHNQSFISLCDAKLIPVVRNINKSLEQRCFEGPSNLRSGSNFSVDQGNEKACRASEASEHNKCPNVAGLEFQHPNEIKSSCVPNQKTHCHLHPSRLPQEIAVHQNSGVLKPKFSCKPPSSTRAKKRQKYTNILQELRTQVAKRSLVTREKYEKESLLLGIEFLLTGFSSQKGKEIEVLIQKYGGMVLSTIPPANSRKRRNAKSNVRQLPVILCPKKLKTTQFLYGCAVNAPILKPKWLTDSIAAGAVLPPEKYMILSNRAGVVMSGIGMPVTDDYNKSMFSRVGFMFLGSHSFCTKFTIVFMHGGGMVFKTLHWLVQSLETKKITVAAIVAEDEKKVSRHLRQCASERQIPVITASWIIKSLYSGKQLRLTENRRPLPTVKVPEIPCLPECSVEI